jgi:hypothetical protein
MKRRGSMPCNRRGSYPSAGDPENCRLQLAHVDGFGQVLGKARLCRNDFECLIKRTIGKVDAQVAVHNQHWLANRLDDVVAELVSDGVHDGW